VIYTVRQLINELVEIASAHGDACQVGIDDADTSWELPLEEVTFDLKTKRVLLKGDYHGEEFSADPQGDPK
jgi:hypothetical protein